MRVLHIADVFAGQAAILSRRERALGLISDVMAPYPDPMSGHVADITLGARGGRTPREIGVRVRAGLQAPLDYDVLHYHGPTLFSWDDMEAGSPFRFLDLKIARALGRRIVFTLQTQPDAGLIETILPLYADKVFYGQPALGHQLEGAAFLPSFDIDVQALDVVAPRASGPATIAVIAADSAAEDDHAMPASIRALKAEFDISVVSAPDGPLEAIQDLLRDADLVIDPAPSGWYGPLAVAAMAMGKLVACSLNAADLVNIPAAMRQEIPVIDFERYRPADGLRSILSARDRWAGLSDAGRLYVERWHDPAATAQAMATTYGHPDRSLRAAPR